MQFGHNFPPSSPLFYSKHRVFISVDISAPACVAVEALWLCTRVWWTIRTSGPGVEVRPPFSGWSCWDVMCTWTGCWKLDFMPVPFWQAFIHLPEHITKIILNEATKMALGVLSHSLLWYLSKRWHNKLNVVKLPGNEKQFIAVSLGRQVIQTRKSNTERKQPNRG